MYFCLGWAYDLMVDKKQKEIDAILDGVDTARRDDTKKE